MKHMTDDIIAKHVVEKKITAGHITNVMITALEGGIGYWAVLDNTTPEFEYYYENNNLKLSTSEIAAEILFNNKSVFFEDNEDETERFELTLEKLVNGIKQFFMEHKDVDLWDIDANDGDTIIQYALFGELIYGQKGKKYCMNSKEKILSGSVEELESNFNDMARLKVFIENEYLDVIKQLEKILGVVEVRENQDFTKGFRECLGLLTHIFHQNVEDAIDVLKDIKKEIESRETTEKVDA